MLQIIRIVIFSTAVCFAGTTCAADSLVKDLNHRLAVTGVEAVNIHLSANWDTKMVRLGRLVQRCDRDALKLSVRLLNTTHTEALQGHGYVLELAMGRCPETLLPLVPAARLESLCNVAAYSDTHPEANLVAEIDRRLDYIRKVGWLAASPNGRACMDAYAEAKQRLLWP
jgi:hypothetical protein